jgi:competence protein ComEC
MLIDTGNRDDSQLITGYLDDLGITELKYIVFTHPHEDHIGSGEAIISQVSVDRIYKMGEYDSSIASSLESAIKNQGIESVTPSSGDTAKLGSCIINFIGPLNNYSDINDDSICLKITFGNTSMLFTGDASSTAERDMIDEGLDLETDILQVGHHGSNQSSSYYFLRESNPKYAVISCGVNNMYGHPHDEVLSRLNDLGADVFRTDEQGTIIATSDGVSITFNCEGKEATRSHVDTQEDASYIGNVNSKVYHVPTCSSLPYENNRVYFTSVDAAEKAGYNPCGRCKPT